MRLIRHPAGLIAAGPQHVLAVGRFDGVHLGHQRLLDVLRTAALARGAQPTVALRPADAALPALTSFRRTVELLRMAGVARVIVLPRDEGRDATSIARWLGASTVVGCTSAMCDDTPESVPAVVLDGERVSSVRLRALVVAGELEAARSGLGRWHSVDGRVVHGFHRGAPLGIPTANLRIRGSVLPPDGVYAVNARISARDLRGVANLGFNPTFGNAVRSVETHLLDFDGDLYGKRLEVAFLRRLRGEQRFPDVEALLAQIHCDVAAARAVFAAADG